MHTTQELQTRLNTRLKITNLKDSEFTKNAKAQIAWEQKCKKELPQLLELIKDEDKPSQIIRKLKKLRDLVYDQEFDEEDPEFLFSPVIYDGMFAYLSEKAEELKLSEEYKEELQSALWEARLSFRKELSKHEKLISNAKEDIDLLLFRHFNNNELENSKLFTRWLAFYAYVLPQENYRRIINNIKNCFNDIKFTVELEEALDNLLEISREFHESDENTQQEIIKNTYYGSHLFSYAPTILKFLLFYLMFSSLFGLVETQEKDSKEDNSLNVYRDLAEKNIEVLENPISEAIGFYYATPSPNFPSHQEAFLSTLSEQYLEVEKAGGFPSEKEISNQYTKAITFANAQQYKKAIEIYDEIIQSYPADSDAYFLRAVNKEISGASIKSIEEDYTYAIELAPNNSEYYEMRSIFYDSIGKYKESLDDRVRVIQLTPARDYGNTIIPTLVETTEPLPKDLQTIIDSVPIEFIPNSSQLKAAAKEGDALAIFQIGKEYRNILANLMERKENFEEQKTLEILIHTLFKHAEMRGHLEARRISLANLKVKTINNDHIPILKKYIEEPLANFKLSHFYLKEENYEKGIHYLKNALAQMTSDSVDISFLPSIIYELAQTIQAHEGTLEKYKAFLKKAAELGHPEAKKMLNLVGLADTPIRESFPLDEDEKQTPKPISSPQIPEIPTKTESYTFSDIIFNPLAIGGIIGIGIIGVGTYFVNRRNKKQQEAIEQKQKLLNEYKQRLQELQEFFDNRFPHTRIKGENFKKSHEKLTTVQEITFLWPFPSNMESYTIIDSINYRKFEILNKNLKEIYLKHFRSLNITVEEKLFVPTDKRIKPCSVVVLSNFPENLKAAGSNPTEFRKKLEDDLYQCSDAFVKETKEEQSKMINEFLRSLFPKELFANNANEKISIDERHIVDRITINPENEISVFIYKKNLRFNIKNNALYESLFEVLKETKGFPVNFSFERKFSENKDKEVYILKIDNPLPHKFPPYKTACTSLQKRLEKKLFKHYENEQHRIKSQIHNPISSHQGKATPSVLGTISSTPKVEATEEPPVKKNAIPTATLRKRNPNISKKRKEPEAEYYLGEKSFDEKNSIMNLVPKQETTLKKQSPPRETVVPKEVKNEKTVLQDCYLALSACYTAFSDNKPEQESPSYKVYQYALHHHLLNFFKALEQYEERCQDEQDNFLSERKQAADLKHIFMHDVPVQEFGLSASGEGSSSGNTTDYFQDAILPLASTLFNSFEFLVKNGNETPTINLKTANFDSLWNIKEIHRRDIPVETRIKHILSIVNELEHLLKPIHNRSEVELHPNYVAALKYALMLIGEHLQQIKQQHPEYHEKLCYGIPGYAGLVMLCYLKTRNPMSHKTIQVDTTEIYSVQEEISSHAAYDRARALDTMKQHFNDVLENPEKLLAKLPAFSSNSQNDSERLQHILLSLKQIEATYQQSEYERNNYMHQSRLYHRDNIRKEINALQNKEIFSQEKSPVSYNIWNILKSDPKSKEGRTKIDKNDCDLLCKSLESYLKELKGKELIVESEMPEEKNFTLDN